MLSSQKALLNSRRGIRNGRYGAAMWASLAIMAGTASVAPAAAVWTGGGADNNWITAENWQDGWGPALWPADVPDVELTNSTTGLSVVDGAHAVNNLKFANSLPTSFTLSGSETLTVKNGITTQFAGHAPYAVSTNINLTGGTILSGYAEGLQFSGNISGSSITFQTSDSATIEIMSGGSVGTPGGGSDVTLDGAAAWAAGVVTLQLNTNTGIDDTADLFMADGTDGKNGRLNLNFATGLSEIVASLTIGGTVMEPGTYGATGSGASNIDDDHFSGTGMLQVAPEPASMVLGAASGMLLLARRRRRV